MPKPTTLLQTASDFMVTGVLENQAFLAGRGREKKRDVGYVRYYIFKGLLSVTSSNLVLRVVLIFVMQGRNTVARRVQKLSI